MAARTLSSHEENEEEEKEEDLGSALFDCNLIRTLIKLTGILWIWDLLRSYWNPISILIPFIRNPLDLGSVPFLLKSDQGPIQIQ